MVATVLKMPLRFVPTNWNAAMAATAIRAAIRPYSIAVAPLSSLKSLVIVVSITDVPFPGVAVLNRIKAGL